MPKRSYNNYTTPPLRSAFTLIEILATVAILAVIVGVAVFYTVGYVSTSSQRASQQTLLVLNQALTRYKTQGGSVTSLTSGAPIANVLARMGATLSWAGYEHTVLNRGFTLRAASLSAVGSGAQYTFYRYHDYTDSTIAPSASIASAEMSDAEAGVAAVITVNLSLPVTGTIVPLAFRITHDGEDYATGSGAGIEWGNSIASIVLANSTTITITMGNEDFGSGLVPVDFFNSDPVYVRIVSDTGLVANGKPLTFPTGNIEAGRP